MPQRYLGVPAIGLVENVTLHVKDLTEHKRVVSNQGSRTNSRSPLGAAPLPQFSLFTMSTAPPSPIIRRARTRSISSLDGMMSPDPQDIQGLTTLTRKLRRAKRQLLLNAAKEPASPVDKLRGILLQVSVDTLSVPEFETSLPELPAARE